MYLPRLSTRVPIDRNGQFAAFCNSVNGFEVAEELLNTAACTGGAGNPAVIRTYRNVPGYTGMFCYVEIPNLTVPSGMLFEYKRYLVDTEIVYYDDNLSETIRIADPYIERVFGVISDMQEYQ